MTATEALQAANDFAKEYNLCETQRSRLCTTIRVFFFEKEPPTMSKQIFESLTRCYKQKRKKQKTLKIAKEIEKL